MLKESGIDPRWDDGLNNKGIDMKDKAVNIIWFLVFAVFCLGVTKWGMDTNNLINLQSDKTALEIKILKHELKAYEEMDKELAE